MRDLWRTDIALALDKVTRILRYEGVLGLTSILYQKLTKPKKTAGTYAQWIAQYDEMDDARRHTLQQQGATFSHTPLISIILPVPHAATPGLRRTLQSVRQQLYPHWELFLVADTSVAVDDLIGADGPTMAAANISVHRQSGLTGRVNASNAGLALATGEYVIVLNPNDTLAEHALHSVVEAINHHPQACLLYADEDTLTPEGKRRDPYFKCDFNYELFLAQDFISSLAVYRRSSIQEVGGLRADYEAAPLYDLTLRLLDHLGIDHLAPSQIAHAIVHIPRVLCHCALASTVPEETAPVVATTQRQALRDHLHRRNLEATVSPAPDSPTHHRVRYHLPAVLPLVSIIIPTRDRADLLKTCLDSILQRSTYPNLEIIILDNGSTEPATAQLFSQLPKDRVRILRDDRPFNFSSLNNHGASLAQGDFLCLMNNDIEVITPDWLEEMIAFAQRPNIGCVGARLWYPSGFLQHGGIILGMGGVAGHAHLNLRRGDPGYCSRAILHQSFSAVTAACLVMRRDLFYQVGGFDEALAVAFNDVDLCLRVRQAGFHNVWTPYAEMIHHESASRGYETEPHKQARLQIEANFIQQHWGDILFNDPAYSPNLSLEHHDFPYAFPPRLGKPSRTLEARTT